MVTFDKGYKNVILQEIKFSVYNVFKLIITSPGQRPEVESGNLDRSLVPLREIQGESNVASSLYIDIFIPSPGAKARVLISTGV